jgi:hypothetical protein
MTDAEKALAAERMRSMSRWDLIEVDLFGSEGLQHLAAAELRRREAAGPAPDGNGGRRPTRRRP